ncbi:hypothetical protein CO700_08230 [Citrobacter koseri]|nr:hypothetical protein CO700_08230 [Citrobacter koseri]AVE60065.1 hypothetical protein AM352_17660 [Citrobacter koseri]
MLTPECCCAEFTRTYYHHFHRDHQHNKFRDAGKKSSFRLFKLHVD